MAGYTSDNIAQSASQTVGASVTGQVLTKPTRVEYGDALNIVIDVVVSAITVGTSIAIELQDSWDQSNWTQVGPTGLAPVTPGTYTFRFNVQKTADQAYLPLRSWLRVVATTAAGDSITVTSITRSKAS